MELPSRKLNLQSLGGKLKRSLDTLASVAKVKKARTTAFTHGVRYVVVLAVDATVKNYLINDFCALIHYIYTYKYML